jgi:hypothetical protein
MEREVRSAIRNSSHDIRLVTSPFQMDETIVENVASKSADEHVNPQLQT